MKKLLILAVAAGFVAVSCSKNKPVTGPAVNTLQFDGSADNAALTKAPIALNLATDNISIFAFAGTTVPATAVLADAAAYSALTTPFTGATAYAKNAKFTNTTDPLIYEEETPLATPRKLFWPTYAVPAVPAAGEELSFVSYFPHVAAAANGVDLTNYLVKYDFTAQDVLDPITSKTPNLGFAWAKTESALRTWTGGATNSVQMAYNYKATKITVNFIGDKSSVGDIATGAINVDGSVSGTVTNHGIKSVKLYSTSGLNSDYSLNLLDGTVAIGSVPAVASASAYKFLPVDAAAVPAGINYAHTQAVGYLVPAAHTTFVAGAGNGLKVEIVVAKEAFTAASGIVTDQTYTATIPFDNVTLVNGLEAGKHYAYTIRVGKTGAITFEGTVVDWTDVTFVTPIDVQ